MRERRRLLEDKIAIKQLEHTEKLLESAWMWDGFGGSDLFDQLRPSSQDGENERWVPPAVPSDRRHGSNWPIWRNQVELDELRAQSRMRCEGNSYCIGLLKNLTNNVIGKGYAYTAEPIVKKQPAKPDSEEDADAVDPQAEATAEAAQDVIDNFLRLNNWNGTVDPRGIAIVAGTGEREAYRRVKRDGECLPRFHFQDSGSTLLRFAEPEQLRDPPGATVQAGWSYGIQHRMEPFEDVETPEQYALTWQDATAKGGSEPSAPVEYVPASEMMHLKGPDTDRKIKRGTPAFVYATGAALDRAAKVQRNASIGAAVRAATAEIWQHATATQAGISSMVAGLTEYTRTNARTGKSEQVERVRPGQIRRIPAGQELVPNPTDNSESYLMAGQGDLRQAAAAECAPEFWMAETSSGNYSNLESAAAPAVRAGQCEQEYYKSAYCRIVWKAVEWAAKCGLLPKNIAELITIEVEAPAVLHRNELEKAQEDQIGIQNGWLDRQTACESRGHDWEKVKQRNQEWNDENAPAMDPLTGAPDAPPGQPAKPGAGGSGSKPPFGIPVKEGKDASGHEHAADGKFGTRATSAGDERKARLNKHHNLMQQAKAARQEAFDTAKADAVKTLDSARENSGKLSGHMDNIGFVSGDLSYEHKHELNDWKKKADKDFDAAKGTGREHEVNAALKSEKKAILDRHKVEDAANDTLLDQHAPIADLETLIGEHDETASPKEQFDSLGEIVAKAREAQRIELPADPEWDQYRDSNAKHLFGIIDAAHAARADLKQHVQHRKEMQAIKRGELIEAKFLEANDIDPDAEP